jgi:heavy metal translocating P-type ATPase
MQENNHSTPACCCHVRRTETSPKTTKLAKAVLCYELIEPYLIIISGLAVIASFFQWFPLETAWITIALSGTPIIYKAVVTLFKRRISVEVLIATAIIATIIAYFFFSAGRHGSHEHSYLFAGGEVAFIMALGHWLEERTISRARTGIENLVKLAPQTARKLENDIETIIPATEVLQNDLLRVLPGDTIPVDGNIVSGNTSINQSLLTGESLPVDRADGDAVFGGTINLFGSFTMRATRIGEDSSLAQMIRLVREAEQKKAPMERIADRWASFLVPVSLLTAAIVCTASYFFIGDIEDAFRRAVTILVVFCPCSLVLATPTAIIAAIGNASHHGILIRSGEALEQLGAVNVLAFDKTGTLTRGQPQLTAVYSFDNDYHSDMVLQLAASVETLSEHPLAACIVKTAAEKNLELAKTADFEMYRGQGIIASVTGGTAVTDGEVKKVLIGNEQILKRFGIELSDFQKSQADKRFDLGETLVWVAFADTKTNSDSDEPIPFQNAKIIGFLSLADTIRETSKTAVEQIRNNGVDVLLLTGDNNRAAQNIGRMSGISNIRAELLPDGKVESVTQLQSRGFRVGMVGDGLNDAPALKTADVGIAMGKIGSDLTIDAADVVLVGDDISRLPFLLRLACKTKRTILGNIGLSMGINCVAIILASAGMMGPAVGALVHNAGSLFVIFNASLLLNVRR